MNELILNCNWEEEDEVIITSYEDGYSFKNDKLNILIVSKCKELDVMLTEESSLKLLGFLKEKLEDK